MSNNIVLFQRSILAIAVIVLVIALVASYVSSDSDMLPKLNQALPQAEEFSKISSNPLVFKGLKENKTGKVEQIGYVVVAEANGYGGPITIITGVNLQGEIVKAVIAGHKDTPIFIQMIRSHDFLDEFSGKKISSTFSLDEDIDRVSGATMSSVGITEAVSKGSHLVAKNYFDMEVPEKVRQVKFGFKETVIVILLIMMLVGVKLKLTKLRWITLLGGFIFIGFQFNMAVSLGNIAGILMGYFPPVQEYFFWYLWFLGVPLMIFVLGKNVYCYWLCPFGALQEISAKIGGGKFHCNKDMEKKAKMIKYGLAYLALLLALILKAPGLAAYEPFATLFALNAHGVQWFILPIVVFSTLFIARFWCYYFCPVGVAIEISLKIRSFLKKLLRRERKCKKTQSA